MLEEIWERQLQLTRQFQDIEVANGLLKTFDIPVNLDDVFGPYQLRFTAWCFVEEVSEALAEREPEAIRAELADALHFLVEIFLFCGLTAKDVRTWCRKMIPVSVSTEDEILFGVNRQVTVVFDTIKLRGHLLTSIAALGKAMHLLKNKPWKVKRQPFTAQKALKKALLETLLAFGMSWQHAGGNARMIGEAYLGKAEVNQARIDDGE